MKYESVWLTVKSVSIVSIAIAFSILCYVGAKEIINHFKVQNDLVKEQMIQLSESVISQKIDVDKKLLEEKIKQLNDAIVKLSKERRQTITDVGEIVATLEHKFSEQIGNIYKDAKDKSKDYSEVVIKQEDTKGKEFPVAWAMYSPNYEEGDKWTTGAYPLHLHTKIALGESKDRSDAYVESWFTSNVFNKDKGEKFPVKISSVEWVKRPPNPKKFSFNPRLSLGMAISDDIYPTLNLSAFTYGRSKLDMDWMFLQGGFGGTNSDKYFFQFVPVEYNLGKVIPLVENLFVGPFMDVNNDSEVSWGVGIYVPF